MTEQQSIRFLNARKAYIEQQFHNLNPMQRKAVLTTEGPLLLLAGAGSGKNTFINRFVNGDPEKKIPKMIVLVITSRRSKADELHADEEAEYTCCVGKWGNITSEVYDDGNWERFQDRLRTIQCEWGDQTFYQKSVACTNAFIEGYI